MSPDPTVKRDSEIESQGLRAYRKLIDGEIRLITVRNYTGWAAITRCANRPACDPRVIRTPMMRLRRNLGEGPAIAKYIFVRRRVG